MVRKWAAPGCEDRAAEPTGVHGEAQQAPAPHLHGEEAHREGHPLQGREQVPSLHVELS